MTQSYSFIRNGTRDKRIFPNNFINWERQSISARIGDSARCNKIDKSVERAAPISCEVQLLNTHENRFTRVCNIKKQS